MDAREQLQQTIDVQQGRLVAGVPPDREAALLALLRAIDTLDPAAGPAPDLVTGRVTPSLGALTALRLCLAAPPGTGAVSDLERWAATFLEHCRHLDAARLVARSAIAGEMRVARGREGGFEAWHPGRGSPSRWQERADLDWWARRLAMEAGLPDGGAPGQAVVRRMRYQVPYPAGAEIGGIPVAALEGSLAGLVDRAEGTRADGGPLVLDEGSLVEGIARERGLGVDVVRRAVAALTLDADNAPWHAALPGGPLAPLVRIGLDRLACLGVGMRTEPLFFGLRELRRRDPEGYHNAAHLREVAFRGDLAACLGDRRFVVSPDRIVLRRDDRRNRTDIDAAVFDRKTGTLAVFELKSQDPLARTVAEEERQVENLRRAGRQVAQVLDWIAREGADEVLSRMDRDTSRRFRVHRVVAFVLGRYAAQPGGAERGGRVAWGSWPRFLRALEGASAGNPLLAVHTRLLGEEAPAWEVPAGAAPAEIALGPERLTVWPSWSALQAGRERG